MLTRDTQKEEQYLKFRKALIVQLITVLLSRALLFTPLTINCGVRLRQADYASGNIVMGTSLLMVIANAAVLIEVMKQAMAWLPATSGSVHNHSPVRSNGLPTCDDDDIPDPLRGGKFKKKTGSIHRGSKHAFSGKYETTAPDAETINFGGRSRSRAAKSHCREPFCKKNRNRGGNEETTTCSDTSEVTFGEDLDYSASADENESNMDADDSLRQEPQQTPEEFAAAYRRKMTDEIKERMRNEARQKRSEQAHSPRTSAKNASTHSQPSMPNVSGSSRSRSQNSQETEEGDAPIVDHSSIFKTGQPAQGDHYEMLGLRRNAGEAELKRAFYRLSKKWHPDKNPDHVAEAEVVFKGIKAAYETLSDPDKRRKYNKSISR